MQRDDERSVAEDPFKMAVSKSCNLVLTAEFYWYPVKFLVKRCYLISSSFFDHEVITVTGCDCAFNFEYFMVCLSYYYSIIYIVDLLL